MKNKLIRYAILSILMTPASNAIAHEMVINKNQSFDVYVPSIEQSNEFTVGAIFLRPGGSNDYGVLVSPFNPNVSAPILSPSWEAKGIDPDFSTGFMLNFRHVFPCSGNDVNIYWAHLRANDGATYPVNRQPPPAQQMTGPFWNVGPDAGPTSAASAQLSNHYDVVNLEVGKQINADPNLMLRLFGGVSGLWIQQKIAADFAGTDPILGPYTFGITTKSEFNAAGIRFGIGSEYEGWCNINVVGLLAGNLFIGRQEPDTQTTGTGSILTTAGIPVNNQSISHEHYTQVVPALDAKLGLKYSRQYSHDASFAIEAGYMASIYLNAMQNYVPSTYVPGSLGIVSGSVYLQSLLKATESFSVDGPYATFSIKF